MELIQQSFALMAVFALLGAAVWFIKTRQRPGPRNRGERRMRVIEQIALTPQHTLCLVKVGERLLMIGTAPSSCHLIETVEEQIR